MYTAELFVHLVVKWFICKNELVVMFYINMRKKAEFWVVIKHINFIVAAKMRLWNGSTANHGCFNSCQIWCPHPALMQLGKDSVR